jgi:hypothetical protein
VEGLPGEKDAAAKSAGPCCVKRGGERQLGSGGKGACHMKEADRGSQEREAPARRNLLPVRCDKQQDPRYEEQAT